MRQLKMLILLILLVLSGCHWTLFRYDMADGDEGLAFYRPPAEDEHVILAQMPAADIKNVILCIGDGMGFEHVAMSRQAVLADRLWMETLPQRGEATTHSANKKVTDSAAAGTALACGVKTDNGMIGMTPDKTPYCSILEALADTGRRTGLVATSQITHATPASFAAHVTSRNDQAGIAPQLLDNRVDVLLGGGGKYWQGTEAGGIRTDGRDVLNEARNAGYQVAETREGMSRFKRTPVLGLFGKDGLTTFAPEPSLPEMSRTAIELLSGGNGKGFFLMIEGSQIDWAAHANDTDRVVRQTLLFDMAVREAIEFAKRDHHTLVIVTADHETGGLKLEAEDNASPKACWTSGGHTAAHVPVYAFGPGAKRITGVLDNTDIPRCIAELTGAAPFPRRLSE